jgi:signal recognition particle subunit SRP54
VVGCPIYLVGLGERQEDLMPFHPERMASRILGMGDVVSLVEKAQETLDLQSARKMEEKLRKNTLDLEDFLEQLQQMRKLGPLENLLEMLPGAANVSPSDKSRMGELSGREFARAEAIIRSMTRQERRHPEILNASRRRRIARGSGTDVASVNDLLKRFEQARKMARRLKEAQKRLPRFGLK